MEGSVSQPAPESKAPAEPVVSLLRRSPEIGKLASALAKAQAKFVHPKKDKHAEIRSDKGDYSYEYADLASVIDAVRLPLAENDLTPIQTPWAGNGVCVVTTLLAHSSGEWLESELSFPIADRRPQTLGSIITYLRRYALGALLGVASEADDDAKFAQEAAMGQGQNRGGGGGQNRSGPPPGQELYRGAEDQKKKLFSTMQSRNFPEALAAKVHQEIIGKPFNDETITSAMKKVQNAAQSSQAAPRASAEQG